MTFRIGRYYRGNRDIKPQQWGTPADVQSSIFANADREGYDPGSIDYYIPTWEGAGLTLHDVARGGMGSLLGGASFDGKNALSFDGTNDYVSFDSKTNLAVKNFTFLCWVYRTGSDSRHCITESEPDWYTQQLEVDALSRLVTYWRDSSDTSRTLDTSNVFPPLGDWAQVAVTRTETGVYLYGNGELLASNTSTSFYAYPSAIGFHIGTYRSADGRWWSGGIKNIFRSSVPLADSQIAYLSDNPYFLLHRQPSVFYSVPSGEITIKTITDTGSGLDSIAQISNLFSVSDVGSGADGFAGLTAGLSVVDVGSGADTVQADAAVTVQDTGSAIDLIQQISAACSVADTGTGTDNIGQLLASLIVSDTGSGADVITVLKELLKTVTDSGTGTDTISQILASLSVSDTGSGADFINLLKDILKTISDTGSGTDSVSIQPVSVSVQDAGTALDLIGHIAVALSVSDAGTIAEIISTIKTKLVTVTDTGTGTDSTPTISVSLTVSDAGAALDVVGQVLNSLAVSDTGTGLESITKTDFDLLPSGKVTVTFTMKTPGATFDLKTPGATFDIK